jgi:hypothetical protein
MLRSERKGLEFLSNRDSLRLRIGAAGNEQRFVRVTGQPLIRLFFEGPARLSNPGA